MLVSLLQLARIGGVGCRHGYGWSFHLWRHHDQLHLSRRGELKGTVLSETEGGGGKRAQSCAAILTYDGETSHDDHVKKILCGILLWHHVTSLLHTE